MKCTTCGAENRDTARFCGDCATPLVHEVSCPACGSANPRGRTFCDACAHPLADRGSRPDPSAYTPKHLAEKILASKSALEGERKQVTVLFADVKGSMELAEQVDPEEWHRILDRFFQILAEGVHRFEGTVNQYTGDGIMALFGAPIAHEDHAQRACWAALHLADELRRYADELRLSKALNFSVRMGLNSGEVVVGKIGDDLRMDYTAQGHTVGLAARMEQLAEAGRIYLSGHTARLVTGFFRLRDLGPLTVKGVADPVRVHELEGTGALRTRLDVSRARGFSRFVGRVDEMAALEAALARTIAGQGQVVGVVAEPGVGKSRLSYEFTQRCRARGIRVNQAHAVAHGKMIPFLPMLELLRDIHGVTEHDSPQAAREKIAGRFLLLDEALRDGLPLVFDFLGVPDPERPPPRMEAEARQRQLFAIVKRAVQARSRREPAVALIEDLHWLDGGSEAFLEMLVEATAGTRTLLLLNFRPEYHAGWMQGSRYQQLPLLPLGAEAAAELLRDLLGSDAALVPLAALIQERTAGNPFFAEEVVQALVESGVLEGERGAYRLLRPVAALAIPASVQAVLAARIDRLREREKTILQTAAVIGSEFAAPVLERVAELPEAELAAALRVLVAAEFVYEEALYPEAVYAFKHPLTQEVAYRSQLAGRRARVHAAAARAIEATAGGKLDEHAALLAYHWEGAGEAATAAEWHRRAAVWLGARDRRQTLRHWREVRRLLDGVAESPEVLALGIEARAKIIFDATVVDNREDEIARCFAEGSELARRLGNPFATVRLHVMSALNRFHAGEIQQALAQLFEVLSLADASGDVFLRISVRGPLIAGLLVAGRLRESAAIGEELEQLLPPDPDFGAEMFGFSPRAMRLAGQALNRAYTGRLLEVAPTLDAAFEIARRRHDGEVLNAGHHAGMILAEFTGDAALAATHARQAAEVAEMVTAMNVSVFAGRAHLLGERYAEAIDSFARAVSWFRERRISLPFEPLVLASLAEAQLGAGDPSRARATAEEAVKAAHRRQTPLHLIPALLARAWTLLATDDRHAAAEVEAALAEATALVEETEARAFTPFIHVERAALARLQGNDAIRQRELREAHRLFTEMGAPIRAEQVLRQLERH